MLMVFAIALAKFNMRMSFREKKRIFCQTFLAFLCVLCIELVLIPKLPVNAASTASNSIETLKQQQQQVKKQRTSVVKERDRLNNLQQEAQKRLTGLEKNLQTTDSQIKDSELRLFAAMGRLQQLEADLAVAESSYQERQQATIARLQFLQRERLSQGWAVLLHSQNLNDFLSRRRQLKLVYQADQQILAKLTEQANLLTNQKIEVEGTKNEIDLIRQQLLAQKSNYQEQAQSQTQMIQRLNSDRLALEAAQNQLQKDSDALGTLIQQKVAEAKAREEAAKASNRKGIFIKGTGIMALPSDAYTSSPFGWRIHPILGYRRFHSGIDFAGNYGSTIRAADSGTVIVAGWYGGYGNAVVIDHGKGITTLYGHSSQLYVSEGQSVQRGQAIAAVGSTGLSTGPHLHFEVRRDGTPVDPASYL
jgi:murein DD-endopeptidase MepM/ murein hydrolase activator NlpD